MSDNLISLTDIENVQEKGMNSERTYSKQMNTLSSKMDTLKYSDNRSTKVKNHSKERSKSKTKGTTKVAKQKENDSRRSNPKQYKPFMQNQELDHIPSKHESQRANPFKDKPVVLSTESPIGRNHVNSGLLHSQISEEIMLKNTAQRTIQHENEGLKNEIISLQTQL